MKHITNNFITNFAIFILFTIIIFQPETVYAMSPETGNQLITDYYGNKEYIGTDSYAYYNTFESQKIVSTNSIAELESTPVRAELEDTSIKKPTCFNKTNSINNTIQTNRLCVPIFELNAMSIEGSMSTETYDKYYFDYRHQTMMENMMENITQYETYRSKSFFTKIAVFYEEINDNIDFIFIKATEISKRNIYWTVWAKNRGKYQSYKEFKKTWHSNTSIWDRLEKSIRHEVDKDIKHLLGSDMKKYIKKSVKKEVEKSLRENNLFKRK